jgi:hypothetical protein
MSSPWAAGASTWQPRAICYAGPAALSNTRWRGCYPPNQLGGLAGPPSFCEAVLNLCRSATLGLPRAPLVARQSLGRPSRLTTGPPSLFPVGSQSRSWRRLFRKPWRGAKARFLARRAPFWTWHLGQPELAASGICPPAAKGEPPSRLRVRCLPRSTAAPSGIHCRRPGRPRTPMGEVARALMLASAIIAEWACSRGGRRRSRAGEPPPSAARSLS